MLNCEWVVKAQKKSSFRYINKSSAVFCNLFWLNQAYFLAVLQILRANLLAKDFWRSSKSIYLCYLPVGRSNYFMSVAPSSSDKFSKVFCRCKVSCKVWSCATKTSSISRCKSLEIKLSYRKLSGRERENALPLKRAQLANQTQRFKIPEKIICIFCPTACLIFSVVDS